MIWKIILSCLLGLAVWLLGVGAAIVTGDIETGITNMKAAYIIWGIGVVIEVLIWIL